MKYKSKILNEFVKEDLFGKVPVFKIKAKGIPRCQRMTPEQVESNLWTQCRPDGDGCWNWTARLTPGGYGGFRYDDNQVASRAAWVFENGEIPKGMQVCHRCDNRKCIKPDHLFLGTMRDNQMDKINKNRQWRPTGAKAWCAVLNDEKAKDILFFHATTSASIKDLMAKYAIGRSCLVSLLYRESWMHVKKEVWPEIALLRSRNNRKRSRQMPDSRLKSAMLSESL